MMEAAPARCPRPSGLAGWDYPKHLAGRVYGLVVHGDVAGLGGIVGAAVGANRKEGRFSDLVSDAIQAGNTVLVVGTHCDADRTLARAILEASFRGRDGTTTDVS